MLNEGAGIETDLTVVCLEKNNFRIISSAAVRTHDKSHILKHLSTDVEFKDITDELICLGIFGPKSRDLLSKITKEDLSNENFKFGTGKNINLNSTDVWAQRLSYVGELGYELYVKKENGKSRVHFYPVTGRTHQLRIHAAHQDGLNTPIFGDDLYGKKENRLHLHAEYIEFLHPSTNKTMCFTIASDF